MCFFFFKQKTAYEMRISDWSSDVCSSDLARHRDAAQRRRQSLQSEFDLRGYVFADAASERLLSLAAQVARSELPVLVTGPNGAGKEKIAAIVHANSAVRDGPFVALNCGAIPADLVDAGRVGADRESTRLNSSTS